MEAVDFDFDIDLLLSDAPEPMSLPSCGSEDAEASEEIVVPVRVIESESLPERRWSFTSLLLWTRKAAPEESEDGLEESDSFDLSATDPGPPRLSQPSSLLSVQKAAELRRYFPLLLRYSPWTLRYSVLLHGADNLSFFKLTQSALYTLVIIQTDSDEVLGGFASSQWTPAKEFCKSH